MSLNLYCLKSAYFVWKIKSPNRKFLYESEEFSFRDKKWVFALRVSPNNSKQGKKLYKLHLVNLHLNECADEFDIETFIEDKGGKLHSFGVKNVKSVHLSKVLLLEFTRSDLLSHDSPFILGETLTVVFKFFHDIVQIQHLSDAVETDKSFNEIALQKESSQRTLYDSWFTFPEIKPRGLIQPPIWTDVFTYIDSLSEDFQNMKIGNLHLDAELKCRERVIPVHRQILSAQSKVFKDIFQKKNSEGCNKTTISVEMTYPLLKKFIMYIYTGHLCELSEEKAIQLYEAADKYSVERLKKRCSNFLTDNLNEENACLLLAFADAYRDMQLKERALSCIVEKEIHAKSGAWNDLLKRNPNLAVEVLTQAYKSLKSKHSVDNVSIADDKNLKSTSVSKSKPIRKRSELPQPCSTHTFCGQTVNVFSKTLNVKRRSENDFWLSGQLRPSVKLISASVYNSIKKATASNNGFDASQKKRGVRPLPSLRQHLEEAALMNRVPLRSCSSNKEFSTSLRLKKMSPYLWQKKDRDCCSAKLKLPAKQINKKAVHISTGYVKNKNSKEKYKKHS